METEYKQLKITVESKLAERFKSVCIASNNSMAGVLAEYMAKYSQSTVGKKRTPSLSTKRQRREAIEKVVKKLEEIKDCEEEYKERIPENLQSSAVYEASEQWIETLNEAIEVLETLV